MKLAERSSAGALFTVNGKPPTGAPVKRPRTSFPGVPLRPAGKPAITACWWSVLGVQGITKTQWVTTTGLKLCWTSVRTGKARKPCRNQEDMPFLPAVSPGKIGRRANWQKSNVCMVHLWYHKAGQGRVDLEHEAITDNWQKMSTKRKPRFSLPSMFQIRFALSSLL